MRHPTATRPAAVLLLSLLLMASITASTIAISTVIADSGHQSQTIDNFIQASLEADSGLERGLAIVKKGRTARTLAATTAAAAATIGNFKVTAASNSNEHITMPKLDLGQSVAFDILGDGAANPAGQYIAVGGVSAGTADVSWTVIAQDGSTEYSGRHFQTGASLSSATSIDLLGAEVRSGSTNAPGIPGGIILGYRIKVKAVNQAITSLDIAAYSDTAKVNPAPLQSRIVMTSRGTVSDSQSEKTASVLWQLPASPVFNYVLFTENDITPS